MLQPQNKSGRSKNTAAIMFIMIAVVLLGGLWLSRYMATAPDKIENKVAAVEAQALQPVASATQLNGGGPAPGTSATGSGSASPSTSPANSAAATAAAVSPELEAAFTQLRTETLASIPTQSDLRKMDTEAVHFTPQQLLAASLKIGEIAQMVKDHPELSEEGLQFYKQCAENTASPNSVRASCLVDFEKLMKVHASSISPPSVTDHVRQLAAKIMS